MKGIHADCNFCHKPHEYYWVVGAPPVFYKACKTHYEERITSSFRNFRTFLTKEEALPYLLEEVL